MEKQHTLEAMIKKGKFQNVACEKDLRMGCTQKGKENSLHLNGTIYPGI